MLQGDVFGDMFFVVVCLLPSLLPCLFPCLFLCLFLCLFDCLCCCSYVQYSIVAFHGVAAYVCSCLFIHFINFIYNILCVHMFWIVVLMPSGCAWRDVFQCILMSCFFRVTLGVDFF